MKLKILSLCCIIFFGLASVGLTQGNTDISSQTTTPTTSPPAPPGNLKAKDTPNDNGHSITLSWDLSADDGGGSKSVLEYRVYRADAKDGPFILRDKSPAGSTQYVDMGSRENDAKDYLPNGHDYYYKMRSNTADTNVYSETPVIGPIQAVGQWYNTSRTLILLFVLLFTSLMVYFIIKARQGANLFVRKLAGIEAVDEAIGRATEMGKPILYVLGLGTAADIATIASFTILGRVAKKVAEYQTGLIVPCNDPIVMTVAQETVRASYLDAGRPEAYKENMVYFATSMQFPYVAAVNGTMLRELPATNIYMGKFYAESLLLAETGALAGSIQIAGTDEVAQIPFFVVACDYTLIGEELYAASAYLGREPILLGSLKAQDYAKAAIIALAIIGMIAANFHWNNFTEIFHITN